MKSFTMKRMRAWKEKVGMKKVEERMTLLIIDNYMKKTFKEKFISFMDNHSSKLIKGLYIYGAFFEVLVGLVNLYYGRYEVSMLHFVIALWINSSYQNFIYAERLRQIAKDSFDTAQSAINLLKEIHEKIKEVDISPSDEAMKSTPAPEGVKANEPY